MSSDPKIPEKVFRQAFDSAPFGVAVVGGNNEWLYVNKALAESFGYALAEWPKNRTWRDFTLDKDIDGDQAAVDECKKRNGPNGYSLEKRYHRKNEGEWFWAELTVDVVRADDGEFQHFISYIVPKGQPAIRAAMLLWLVKNWKPIGAAIVGGAISIGWAFGLISDEKFEALKELIF